MTPAYALYKWAQFRHAWPKRRKDATPRLAPAVEILARHCLDVRTIADIGPRNTVEVDLLEQAFPGATVDAIDLFPTSARIRKGDLHRLPIADGWADCAFLSHVFEHALDPDRATREIARVLRPGGYLWVAMPRNFRPSRHDRVVFDDRKEIVAAFEHAGPVDVLYDGSNEREWRLLLRLWKDRGTSLRVLVVLPDALAKRNWVDTGLLDLLRERGHEALIVCSKNHNFARHWELEACWGARWRRALRRHWLRTASYVAREGREFTLAHKLSLRKPIRRRLEIAVLRALHRIVDVERLARLVERWLPVDRNAVAVIRAARPDVLIAHTSVYQGECDELLKSARRANIPTILQPASFDTLSSKGHPLVPADHVLVWGEASREHAVRLHGYRPEQVHVTGAPQFDPYSAVAALPMAHILVAGTSLAYAPEEHDLIRRLSDLWSTGALGHLTIRYRPHPWRGQSHRDLEGLPGVYISDPSLDAGLIRPWVIGEAAAIVSAFSTVCLEGALVGKPIFLVGFGQTTGGQEGGGGTGDLLQHAKYEHMREIASWPGVTLCRSWDYLMEGLLKVANGHVSPTVLQETARLAQRVALTDGHAKQRIVEAIEAVGVRR